MYVQVNKYQGIYEKIAMSKKEHNSRFSEGLLDKMDSISEKKQLTLEVNRELSICDTYNYMKNSGLKLKNNTLMTETNGIVQKVDNESYLIEKSDEIAGHWRIYDKRSGRSFVFDPKLTNIQINESTGNKYIMSTDVFGGLIDVMFADDELMESLEQFMNTDNIGTSSLNDKYTIKTDVYTGIECLKVKGDEKGSAWFIVTEERQLEKLRELADVYKKSYPNLIKSDGIAMSFALQEVAEMSIRTENGILSLSCNGMTYTDNYDPSKSWGIMYSIHDTNMYTEIMKAITEGIIAGTDLENFENWEKYFEEKGLHWK